jgi:hypothetical protein
MTSHEREADESGFGTEFDSDSANQLTRPSREPHSSSHEWRGLRRVDRTKLVAGIWAHKGLNPTKRSET